MRLGFRQKDLYFISHYDHASPTSLCESIVFLSQSPRVRITLNLGLLSNHTPLPSFMIKWMEEEDIQPTRFLHFLNYFNNQLIHEFLRNLSPEKNSYFFLNWRETQYHYFSLLGFESISTLWFMIKNCFPELVISIEKTKRTMRLSSKTLILGKDGLGSSCYIGERLEQSFSSFKIIFRTEREVSEQGAPWPIVINLRLYEWVFPILQRTDLHLTIILKINKKTDQFILSKKHFLGFDRIGLSKAPFQLVLFHGFIKDFEKNTFLAG